MSECKKVRIHLAHPRNLWVDKVSKHHSKGAHEVPEEALAHPYAQALIKDGTLTLASDAAKAAADKGADEGIKKVFADHLKLQAQHKELQGDYDDLVSDHKKLKEEHGKLKEELEAANALLSESDTGKKRKQA